MVRGGGEILGEIEGNIFGFRGFSIFARCAFGASKVVQAGTRKEDAAVVGVGKVQRVAKLN